MLHTDFGLVYLGFSTDTQHNAYVLLPGETDAPAGLEGGSARSQSAAGSDDEVRDGGQRPETRRWPRRSPRRGPRGCTPSIYCHPVGYHGHAAGPPIGMTDYQNGVPVRGEYVFRPDTWHSIELNVRHPVPEWGNQMRHVRARRRRGCSRRTGWDWIDGRQTQFYLIK